MAAVALVAGLLWGCSSCSTPSQAVKGTTEPSPKPKPSPPQGTEHGVPLPVSTVATAPGAAPVLMLITTKQISVGHHGKLQKVATLTAGKVDSTAKKGGEEGYLITPLLSALKKNAAADRGAKGRDASGVPLVWADHTTPYRALTEVLYTVGQAGYLRYHLAVRARGRLAAIRFVFPQYKATRDRRAIIKEDHPRLNLVVAISYKGFMVSSGAGELTTVNCSVALANERCPVSFKPGADGQDGRWEDRYDYKKLRTFIEQIKKKYADEREVIVSAGDEIPYQVVVRTLDTVRGKSTEKCTGDDGCLFDQPILAAGVQ